MTRFSGLCVLVSVVFLVITGCGSVKSKPVGHQTYSPRDDNYPIDVFCTRPPQKTINDSAADIEAVFGESYRRNSEIPDNITIGRIEIEGAPNWDWRKMISEARQKARELGGDAIVITRYDYYSTAETTSSVSQPYGKRILAVVMRYTNMNQ